MTAAAGTLAQRLTPKAPPRGDPGEFGTGRADVGDHEHGQRGIAQPRPLPLTYQADKSLPGDDTHACWQAVQEHEGDGGRQQHPQQLVPVVRPKCGVGGDPGRAVVGETREQPRTDHRQQCTETEPVAPEAFHVSLSLVPLRPTRVRRRRGPHPGA